MKAKKLLLLFIVITLSNCSKDNAPELSSENKIISFEINYDENVFTGNINDLTRTITIETIGLESINSIVPDIEISPNATISPNPSIAQNFNENIIYTVTAENGDEAVYNITTVNTPFSNEKKILNFQFDIDGEVFDGIINHADLSVTLETYKDVSYIIPNITVSENAIITPDPNEGQGFNKPVEYTVTAQDGTTNIYTVNVHRANIENTFTKCFIRATSFGRVSYLDLSNPDINLFLENNQNSYELSIYDTAIWDSSGVMMTNFYFDFTEDIVSATDYKLRFKINDEILAETDYVIDVLAENAPEIISANQASYTYNDTLILTGTNLLPGLSIPANFSNYIYNDSYVDVSPDGMTLEFVMDINYGMFPSWLGQPSPRPTRVRIYHEGRYGDSIIVDFN